MCCPDGFHCWHHHLHRLHCWLLGSLCCVHLGQLVDQPVFLSVFALLLDCSAALLPVKIAHCCAAAAAAAAAASVAVHAAAAGQGLHTPRSRHLHHPLPPQGLHMTSCNTFTADSAHTRGQPVANIMASTRMMHNALHMMCSYSGQLSHRTTRTHLVPAPLHPLPCCSPHTPPPAPRHQSHPGHEPDHPGLPRHTWTQHRVHAYVSGAADSCRQADNRCV
jgi:hypothetical protein